MVKAADRQYVAVPSLEAVKSLFPPRETWLPLLFNDVFTLRLTKSLPVHKREESSLSFPILQLLKVIETLTPTLNDKLGMALKWFPAC